MMPTPSTVVSDVRCGRRSKDLVLTAATLALVLLLGLSRATAQAPVAGMHTTQGGGAGLTASVTANGGYATAVPLDLPSPRGPVPVPVSIVHTGSPRAGAAGLGWDVPISYVRRSTTAWQRKPAADDTVGAGERIVVALGGAPSLMVPRGDHYVPFAASDYQELRFEDNVWRLTTLANLEYTFAPAASIEERSFVELYAAAA